MNLQINADAVTIRLSAMEKAGAMHRNVTVPRAAITASWVVPNGLDEVQGLKLVGSGVPGVAMIGTWRSADRKTFAVCHGRKPAVVLELTGESYDRIVLTVDDPEGALAGLQSPGQ